MKYILKKAEKKDYKEIKKLLSLYPDKLMQTHLPKWNYFFVAKNSTGEIVGCCALEEYSKRLSEIRSLVVKPEYQKQGIGRKLVALCLDRAKKRKIVEVLCITSALGLLNKFGFRTFSKEKFALLKMIK